VKEKAAQHPTMPRIAIIIIRRKKKVIFARTRSQQFQNYEILNLKPTHRLGFKTMNTERTVMFLNVKLKF
jgi:hypothetical protein